MDAASIENTFLKIIKRLMLIAIGSGLLGNSLYVYGIGYYQGFIKRLGFEYNLFPIQWGDSLLWTYEASRELGISSISLLNNITSPALLILLVAFYLVARIWMELSNIKPVNKSGKTRKKINFKIAKKIHTFRKNHLLLYKIVYIPFKWLLMKEHSFIAFVASYFFMIFLIFIPLFIIIWIYFPLFGVHHGELVAVTKLEYFKENLCGSSEDYWNGCIKLNVSHLKNYEDVDSPLGRVLFKSGNIIGIMTEEGPVTLSMPKEYYFQTNINRCFKGGCSDTNKVSKSNL